MLTRTEVQRYAAESGLRDMMIAEKEVVLTFLLQLLCERGILDRLAFKGGTCLRKMFVGGQGYSHDWNQGGSEIRIQISRRETPTLPTARLPQLEQSYFRHLPFAHAAITASHCRKSSPRKSEPATNATRRATSTTLACSPRGRSTKRSFAGLSC